jgi:hypothetical protein
MASKMSIHEFLKRHWPKPSEQEVQEAGERVLRRLRVELEKHDTSLRSLYGDDGWNAPPLKQLEFQILAVTSLLGDRAAGPVVFDTLCECAGREVNVGWVFVTLERLYKAGLLTSRTVPPTGPFGDRQLYEVTKLGERALARARVEGKQLETARKTYPKTDVLKDLI